MNLFMARLVVGQCTGPFILVHGTRVLDGEQGEWCILFWRQFGLDETVEWDNLCRQIQALLEDPNEDGMHWALETSGEYSTRSI
jgi:hypothetical protein